ncbi:hypothetical protein J1605_007126 [Eschrichtius robustus]|uniref:non-specific serine/threonine protein kinase n=1 Tax=Eschrichtius robustus TaxID=9764 RepID=A0AB34H1E6_ESCRO|nr:hypothetical protein J1605_007126 [Eschrichtius robustus]
MRRLSNCGSRAQLPRGMWDLPRPGLEPVCPALAGRFLTTAPPGKPPLPLFSTMDKYDVIKAIGEGAFGKAYLAKGKSDSKHCVIKEINFEKVKLRS